MREKVEVDRKTPEKKLEKRLIPGESIGHGGMGEVREAFDVNLRRTVAMKVLRSPKGAQDQIGRFIEEAQITAQLDHPNIIPVYELGLTDRSEPYFTMKRVFGRSLSDLLDDQDGSDRTSEALLRLLEIFLKLLDAVDFAHSRSVLHLDLKPRNVMVGDHGEVYLTDWGLARIQSAPRDAKVLVGSAAYMAPEMFSPEPEALTERTDVFSLGCILYEILTLSPPYCGESLEDEIAKARACTPPPPQEITRVPLPKRLCQITEKAMQRDPAERYPLASAMKSDLEQFLSSGWNYPRRAVEPGTLIVQEGERGEEAYIILQGRCRAFQRVQGRERGVAILGPGDVFGETAVLTGEARMASVEAVDRVALAVVSREIFESEFGAGFWMGQFMKALARRFQDLDRRNVALARALERSELGEHALLHLLLHGRDEQGTRAAAFRPLCAELERRFGRTADELAGLLERTGRFIVDLQAGAIRLRKRA